MKMPEKRTQADHARHKRKLQKMQGQGHGQKPFENIAKQCQHTEMKSTQASNIGGAYIAATGYARIHIAKNFGNNQAKGDGAEQIGPKAKSQAKNMLWCGQREKPRLHTIKSSRTDISSCKRNQKQNKNDYARAFCLPHDLPGH